MSTRNKTMWRILGWSPGQAEAMSKGLFCNEDTPHCTALCPGETSRVAMERIWRESEQARDCCMFHVTNGETEDTFLPKDFDPSVRHDVPRSAEPQPALSAV
jgi:hypothetical protein